MMSAPSSTSTSASLNGTLVSTGHQERNAQSGAIKRKAQDQAPVVAKRTDKKYDPAHTDDFVAWKKYLGASCKSREYEAEYYKIVNKTKDYKFAEEIAAAKKKKIEINEKKIFEEDRFIVQMKKDIGEQKKDKKMKHELKKVLKQLDKEHKKVFEEQKELKVKIEDISDKKAILKSKAKEQKKQKYEFFAAITNIDQRKLMELDGGDYCDSDEEVARREKEHERYQRISMKSEAVTDLDNQLKKTQAELDERTVARTKLVGRCLKAQIHDMKRAIEALKKENKGLEEVLRKTQKRLEFYTEVLEEYKEKKIQHRRLTEKYAGTVASHKCIDCEEEFEGPKEI